MRNDAYQEFDDSDLLHSDMVNDSLKTLLILRAGIKRNINSCMGVVEFHRMRMISEAEAAIRFRKELADVEDAIRLVKNKDTLIPKLNAAENQFVFDGNGEKL